MATLKKIQQLNDNETIQLFNGFSGYLQSKLKVEVEELIAHPPGKLKELDSLGQIQNIDFDMLGMGLAPQEALPTARTLLEIWAADPAIAPMLEDYMASNDINTMAAGAILAVGAVILMTVVSTSLKVKYDGGEWTVDYDSQNISDNAVEIVKTVLDKIPNSIKNIMN